MGCIRFSGHRDQWCQTDGESYCMRGHRAKLAELRRGLSGLRPSLITHRSGDYAERRNA
jgi:hypothetical protein